MSSAEEIPKIVESDGRTVLIQCGSLEVVGDFSRLGEGLYLEGAHVGGESANSLGIARLRTLARAFILDQGARHLTVWGATRTSGSNPGHRPKRIIFSLDPM